MVAVAIEVEGGTTMSDVRQGTEGEGKEPEHTHPAIEHSHDHWHVSHHHKGGLLGDDFEHRASWHTHAHNHAPLTHGHDYSQEEEERDHAKEAHIHDHTAPTEHLEGIAGSYHRH
jgi:hypothetical protein